MRIEDLSLSERHGLEFAATVASIDRLRKLLRWSDPRDEELQGFLGSLIQNEERRMGELEDAGRRIDRSGPCRLRHAQILALLKEYFPSFFKHLGECPIDREHGMYLAECLEEESSRFYRQMVRSALDPSSRELFLRLKKEDDSFLQLVRDVVLGGGD
ncbi:MAG TPA: hypothetical protein VKU80_15030 [Planctomycetota bacterium]|nr:hypothetical protein [Planctomycetota bacterium]